MIRAGELGPVPDRLVPLASRELAWNFDRLPPHTLSDRQPLCFALAERCPQRLPAAQLTNAGRPLRKWKEKAVAHAAVTPVRGATNAPSAVVHTMTGLWTAADRWPSAPRSISARMLPPKPAPMMRAP